MDIKCLNCGCKFVSLKKNAVCPACGVKTSQKVVETTQKTNKFSTDQIYAKNIDKVVSIITACTGGERHGTGIIVNDYVLTNAHVVNECVDSEYKASYSINVVKNDNTNCEANLEYYNEQLDIAIYKLEQNIGKGYNLLKDISKNFTVGEEVLTIGNALGKGLIITTGIIGSETRKVDGYERIVITNEVANGNSGGPVYNSKNKLIGIVFAGETEGRFINYVIPINDVVDFIKDFENKENVKIL